MLNYENLLFLFFVWEVRKLSRDEDDNLGLKILFLNGYYSNLDLMYNYVNIENVIVSVSVYKVEYLRRRDCIFIVFNFDIRRLSLEYR